MKNLHLLKSAKTKPDLARILRIPPSFLTYNLYIKDQKDQYIVFKIPKKNGGERVIKSPTKNLKKIQSSLSRLLLDCLDEINEAKNPNSTLGPNGIKIDKSEILKIKIPSSKSRQFSISHGFERNRSIITNSMMHLQKKHVFNIDLENFFDSFNFGRVRGFFIKNKNFQLHPEIATTIAKIACYENGLPQGSPCSPVISNLITHSLDIKLANLAFKNSCTYTRYADDITFSSREKILPKKIGYKKNNLYLIGKKLHLEIKRSGFNVNQNKTRNQYKNSRQEVTGIIVNQKPNIKKEYWKTVRAQCNFLFKKGYFLTTENGVSFNGSIESLEGKLNFIDQVDYYNKSRQKPPLNPNYQKKSDQKSEKKKKQYLYTGREQTFSNFLFYKLFFANTTPTILTEGKTDNIYLKSAINILHKDYKQLTTEKKININFLNYTKRTRYLLELYGGTDYLKDFIISYKLKSKKYLVKNQEKPVIIILDNDSGSKNIINYIRGIDGIKKYPEETIEIKDADFIHLFQNLYIILTPRINNQDTDIEYFFSEKDRLRKHKGKHFNTIEKRNEQIDLSKDSFATHIVNKHKRTINFNGHRPILDRIVKVLEHHEKNHPAPNHV